MKSSQIDWRKTVSCWSGFDMIGTSGCGQRESTVNPKRFCSSLNGAEAPKPLMQTLAPSMPTQRSQPKPVACSTQTRARSSGGRTASR